MKRMIWAGLVFGALVALSVGLVQSAPAAGSALSVRALKARIMAGPEFLGTTVATVKRGARVQVISAKGSWYQVSYQGRRGWIHKNRVTEKIIKLSSGDTGSGITRGEAELAGRGFSPQTEAGFRQKNPNLDYSHVDKIQEADVDPASVQTFRDEGKVSGPVGRRK